MAAVELTLPVPVPIVAPEKPYNLVAIDLSLSTTAAMPPIGGALDANLSARLRWYRVLEVEIDGVTTPIADFAPDIFGKNLQVGSLIEAAASGDQALVAAIGAIQAALQAYINSALQPPEPEPEPEPQPEEPQ